MLSGPPRLIPFVFVLLALVLVWWYLHAVPAASTPWTPAKLLKRPPPSLRPGVDPLDFGIPLRFSDGRPKPPGSNYTFKIVVPKTVKEDLEWMRKEIPDAPVVVYEVDNPNAENKVPQNKGREAMVRDSHTRIAGELQC
jgi:hypothetical protein